MFMNALISLQSIIIGMIENVDDTDDEQNILNFLSLMFLLLNFTIILHKTTAQTLIQLVQ